MPGASTEAARRNHLGVSVDPHDAAGEQECERYSGRRLGRPDAVSDPEPARCALEQGDQRKSLLATEKRRPMSGNRSFRRQQRPLDRQQHEL